MTENNRGLQFFCPPHISETCKHRHGCTKRLSENDRRRFDEMGIVAFSLTTWKFEYKNCKLYEPEGGDR